MSDKTILEINLNNDYKIKIEKGNQFRKSIFNEVYQNALKNIIEIVKQSDIQNKPLYSRENNFFQYEDYNNIIAFTGERGKGKSSSMISFRNALIYKDSDEHNDFFQATLNDQDKELGFFDDLSRQINFLDYELLSKKSFVEIEIIDPSLFRGGERLLEIILAKMFQKFQQQVKRNNYEISQNDKREIIENFRDVFQNLQIINSDRKDLYKKESIEALSKLATSSNLKESFKVLVNNYLDKFEKNRDFLVITIDDFDLNIANAYDMLEDIRQFLILKRIILLIACKVEQLSDGIRNNIAKSIPNLFSTNIMNIDGFYIHDSLKSLAFKYLEKLLPLNRRIVLPTIRVDQKISLKINYNGKILNYSTIENCILELIFIKSKVFIPKNSEDQNLIIPSNLRGIIDLISFLFYIKNAEELLNYFILLKLEYLEGNDIKILNELNPGTNVFNKFIISFLINNDKSIKGYNYHIQHQLIGNVYDIYNNLSKNIISFTNPGQYRSIHYKIILYNIVNSIKFQNKNSSINLNELFVSEGTIFPKDIKNNIYRDRFIFGNFSKVIKDTNLTNLFILLSFTPFVYNENKNLSFYNFYLSNDDTNPEFACFNALSFINVIVNPNDLFNRIDHLEILGDNTELDNLKNSFIEYNNSDFLLFTNVDFLQIFFEKLYRRTRFKRKDFASTIYAYLRISISNVLKEMNLEYSHLNVDVNNFVNNPIFKYWEQNLDEINRLFNQIFSYAVNRNNYSKVDIDIANYALSRYSRYFSFDADYSPRGAKQAMNSLIKLFESNEEIKSTLVNYRSLMDQDLDEGLFEINEFLKSIK